MKRSGFTLVEILVVIVVLAILMAVAVPLYMRAVRDSARHTCRSNMQVVAHAEQAYKVRSAGHVYTTDLTQLIGLTEDMQVLPRCPSDDSADTTDDYRVEINEDDGQITIFCNSGNALDQSYHNAVGSELGRGFTPGKDAE